MKRKRHTPEQIVRKLREGDRMLNEGTELTEVLRHLEVSDSSWPDGPDARMDHAVGVHVHGPHNLILTGVSSLGPKRCSAAEHPGLVTSR